MVRMWLLTKAKIDFERDFEKAFSMGCTGPAGLGKRAMKKRGPRRPAQSNVYFKPAYNGSYVFWRLIRV